MIATWMYYIGGIIVAFIISIIWEDGRDWWTEVWDSFISFEFLGSLWDFITSAFTDLGEFSIYGLVFGCLTAITVYLLSDWTLKPFLQYYDVSGKILWGTITYAGTFIAGYFMGKAFENTG